MASSMLLFYVSGRLGLLKSFYPDMDISALGNFGTIQSIPNGCFDAYEVKVNKDIFKYQEKVKVISQFQRFFKIFNGLFPYASFP